MTEQPISINYFSVI